MLTDEIMQRLRNVIEYLKDSEQKHFEECSEEEKENHIFQDVKFIDSWIKGGFN